MTIPEAWDRLHQHACPPSARFELLQLEGLCVLKEWHRLVLRLQDCFQGVAMVMDEVESSAC